LTKKAGIVIAIVLVASLTVSLVARGIDPTGQDPQIPEEITGAWFRAADYTGIMNRVAAGSDPDLFYADQALDNTIYVWPGFEPYRYEDEIDWQVGGKSNTWYLYFQSLRVVGYLANAGEVSGDVRYLEKAAEIIESWIDFHYQIRVPRPSVWNALRLLRAVAGTARTGGYGPYPEKAVEMIEAWFDPGAIIEMPPPYAWDDHAAASRTRNVMHFLRAYQALPEAELPNSFFEKIAAMLYQHGNWLLDERNYHPNNHGLMASMALTQIALTLPELDRDGSWKHTGIDRVRERIEADLSVERVHLEHAAAYHLLFLNLVLQVDEYLDTRGVPLFEPDDETVEEMKQYVAYMVKPDGRLPMIGDTSDGVLARHYGHPWVIYSLSDGRQGTRPPASSMVYPDAGVAILRDEWRTGSDFADTTYLMFQSKFLMPGHKHADDLGFLLYSHGEDIFVGPGVYAYDRSEYRQYVRSAQAHNTLTVDGQSYAISRDNIGKAGITAHRMDEAFDFVQGSHTMYEGVTLKRGIVFIRPSTVLVIDEAVSGADHSIQQIWNLSPAAHDLQFDKDGASFLVGENGVSVEMRQISPAEDVNHYYGHEDPVRGFISPRQWELVPVHQLEFERSGSGVVFVTQISVTGPDEQAPTIELDPDNPYRDIVVHQSDGTTLTINLEPGL